MNPTSDPDGETTENPGDSESQETPSPGVDLLSTEGADAFQTAEEAVENDNQLREDLNEDEIISLDSSD